MRRKRNPAKEMEAISKLLKGGSTLREACEKRGYGISRYYSLRKRSMARPYEEFKNRLFEQSGAKAALGPQKLAELNTQDSIISSSIKRMETNNLTIPPNMMTLMVGDSTPAFKVRFGNITLTVQRD